jgi:phenylacetyl-CoA:acceptor oxidoreductase 27-kDa subunit
LPHWAMIIDLRRCIGCGACAVSCGMANNTETNMWRRVFDCGAPATPEKRRLSLPMSCMHCRVPPCEKVCPTTATYIREDSIVDVDFEKCIGCGYCIVACPYLSRVIIARNDALQEGRVMTSTPEKYHKGNEYCNVASKCNFCKERVDQGIAMGLEPGADPAATPACVVNCTAKALHFGDLDNPRSEVSLLLKESRVVCLQEEIGTQPSLYYIVDDSLEADLRAGHPG